MFWISAASLFSIPNCLYNHFFYLWLLYHIYIYCAMYDQDQRRLVHLSTLQIKTRKGWQKMSSWYSCLVIFTIPQFVGVILTFYLNVSSVAIKRNIVYWNTIVIYSNSAANAIILLINFRGPNQKQVSRFVVNKMKPFSAWFPLKGHTYLNKPAAYRKTWNVLHFNWWGRRLQTFKVSEHWYAVIVFCKTFWNNLDTFF